VISFSAISFGGGLYRAAQWSVTLTGPPVLLTVSVSWAEGVFVHDFMNSGNVYFNDSDFVGYLHGVTRVRRRWCANTAMPLEGRACFSQFMNTGYFYHVTIVEVEI